MLSLSHLYKISGIVKPGGSVTRGQNIGWIVSANVEVGKDCEKEISEEYRDPYAKII